VKKVKNALYTGSLGLALCLVFASTAVATSVEFLGNHGESWLVQSDATVAHYENIVWKPPVKRDKRDIHEAGPGLASVNCVVQRAICWRLDRGRVDRINWTPVRAQLQAKFGRKIGEMVHCVAGGVVIAPECHSGTVDVFTIYVRERYRVTQRGEVAEISILRPTDGLGFVYSELIWLNYRSCDGVTLPLNTSATCGSIGDHPIVGIPCLPGGLRTKRQFKEDPVPGQESRVSATWGRIKALYATE